jgi:hypothetical protein
MQTIGITSAIQFDKGAQPAAGQVLRLHSRRSTTGGLTATPDWTTISISWRHQARLLLPVLRRVDLCRTAQMQSLAECSLLRVARRAALRRHSVMPCRSDCSNCKCATSAAADGCAVRREGIGTKPPASVEVSGGCREDSRGGRKKHDIPNGFRRVRGVSWMVWCRPAWGAPLRPALNGRYVLLLLWREVRGRGEEG